LTVAILEPDKSIRQLATKKALGPQSSAEKLKMGATLEARRSPIDESSINQERSRIHLSPNLEFLHVERGAHPHFRMRCLTKAV
jgi:hypothetical protein